MNNEASRKLHSLCDHHLPTLKAVAVTFMVACDVIACIKVIGTSTPAVRYEGIVCSASGSSGPGRLYLAYMLSSVAVDLDIMQLVDGKPEVHAMCPKGMFEKL